MQNVAAHDHALNGKTRVNPAAPPNAPQERTHAPAVDRSSPATERVLAAFQETMQTFLEVQRSTMLAYLSGKQPRVAGLTDCPVDKPTPSERSAPHERPARPATAAASSVTENRWPSAPAARAVAPATASKPAASIPAGRDEISKKLLEIVRERTGYPPEVLRLDLDLEAELGIDSIKRVEILGKLRDAFPQLGSGADSEAMDRLVSAKTLAAIVERAELAISRESAAAKPIVPVVEAAKPRQAAVNGTRKDKLLGTTRRLLLETVEAPLEGIESSLMPGGTVLITEDDRGIAEALASAIRSRGWPTAMIGGRDSRLDWTSPDAVDQAIRQAHCAGSLAGLVHLSPFRSSRMPDIDTSAWADRMSTEVRGLFLLAKGMARDLEAQPSRVEPA